MDNSNRRCNGLLEARGTQEAWNYTCTKIRDGGAWDAKYFAAIQQITTCSNPFSSFSDESIHWLDLLYTIAYGCQYSNSLIDMEKYSQANVNDMQKLDNPTESEIII